MEDKNIQKNAAIVIVTAILLFMFLVFSTKAWDQGIPSDISDVTIAMQDSIPADEYTYIVYPVAVSYADSGRCPTDLIENFVNSLSKPVNTFYPDIRRMSYVLATKGCIEPPNSSIRDAVWQEMQHTVKYTPLVGLVDTPIPLWGSNDASEQGAFVLFMHWTRDSRSIPYLKTLAYETTDNGGAVNAVVKNNAVKVYNEMRAKPIPRSRPRGL